MSIYFPLSFILENMLEVAIPIITYLGFLFLHVAWLPHPSNSMEVFNHLSSSLLVFKSISFIYANLLL